MTFVIVCLDGFKYEYLEKTKFLKNLSLKNPNGEIYHGFGFASEFSAITGKDIEELGLIVNNFYYNPGKLKFFHFFRFLDLLPFNNLSRLLLNFTYNTKEFLIRNNQPKSIFKIPLKYSIYFDYLIKKNFFTSNLLDHKTIFGILKHKKVSGYMWPFIYEKNKTKIDLANLATNTANTDHIAFIKSLQLLKKNPDICYIHFFSTDNLVHRNGTKSLKTLSLIKNLDKYLEEINKYADKLLIYSDHGMTDINQLVNIKQIIDKTNLVYGKDYIMFLDATLARFWPLHDRAKNLIIKVLENTNKGKLIYFNNQEIHKKFGHLVFQVNPGILILPNFYQNTPDKATHGYDDHSKDEKAMYIFADKTNNRKEIKKISNVKANKSLKKDIKMPEIFNIIMKNINNN